MLEREFFWVFLFLFWSVGSSGVVEGSLDF